MLLFIFQSTLDCTWKQMYTAFKYKVVYLLILSKIWRTSIYRASFVSSYLCFSKCVNFSTGSTMHLWIRKYLQSKLVEIVVHWLHYIIFIQGSTFWCPLNNLTIPLSRLYFERLRLLLLSAKKSRSVSISILYLSKATLLLKSSSM